MPAFAPPVTDERDALLRFLDQQRYVLRLAAHGLTDAESRQSPSASALPVGGLLKHCALTESSWVDVVHTQHFPDVDYLGSFALQEDESLAGALELQAEVAARTASVFATVPLDQEVRKPLGIPWLPADVDAWSVRWVLLHLIEETARHAGHADIVRESLDGAMAFPLMAAAESWPASPWMTPWKRAS